MNAPARGCTLFAFFATLWLGMLLGVSFLATPVKFQAPSLEMPTALEVGRVTFALFVKVEWVLFTLLAIVAFFSRAGAGRWISLAFLFALLLTETLWLLPVLDVRAGQVIAGEKPVATNHHGLYVAAESVKGVVLFLLALSGLRQGASPGTSRPEDGEQSRQRSLHAAEPHR